MKVEFESEKIDLAGIVKIMEDAGYKVFPFENAPTSELKELTPISINNTTNTQEPISSHLENKTNLPTSLIISLSFGCILMYVAMATMLALPLPSFLQGVENLPSLALIQLLLCLPILYTNRQIFRSGLKSALDTRPNMDTLVGLGSGAAALFGIYALWRIYTSQDTAIIEHWSNNLYFDSAGMILALIGLGKYFEEKARGNASKAIDELTKLAPSTAICLRDGQEVSIPTNQVVSGDILVVHSGASIAADGIIIKGSAFIDESLITGESLPVEKHEGQKVIGATISTSGYFQMQVTGVGEQTTLARIIRLVDDALATKAPIARLADKISAIFVPIIITIALLSFATWYMLGYGLEFSMSIAISVLVISCPCALGLATPTAIMVGTGMGAEHGILFKSAAAIEHTQAVDTVILDKTGTLTYGKPRVTDIFALDTKQKNAFLAMAASIEQLSEHPLARAIVNEAKKQNLELTKAEDFENFEQISGLGLKTSYNNSTFLAGNARLLKQMSVKNNLEEQEKTLSAQGKTVLYFAKNNELYGIIAVADAVKETSKRAVQELQKLNLHVLMLTGDNKITAKSVQEQVGIKVKKLQELGHTVIMVGDGINDAPALARAHVGIAIGTGTDIAIQSADMVLMNGDVSQVVSAYKLSKSVMRTIRQNLFWAFAYNIVLIPVAAGLLYVPWQISLNPMLAAASMSLSSLTVVSNALRLRRQSKNIFA